VFKLNFFSNYLQSFGHLDQKMIMYLTPLNPIWGSWDPSKNLSALLNKKNFLIHDFFFTYYNKTISFEK